MARYFDQPVSTPAAGPTSSVKGRAQRGIQLSHPSTLIRAADERNATFCVSERQQRPPSFPPHSLNEWKVTIVHTYTLPFFFCFGFLFSLSLKVPYFTRCQHVISALWVGGPIHQPSSRWWWLLLLLQSSGRSSGVVAARVRCPVTAPKESRKAADCYLFRRQGSLFLTERPYLM